MAGLRIVLISSQKDEAGIVSDSGPSAEYIRVTSDSTPDELFKAMQGADALFIRVSETGLEAMFFDRVGWLSCLACYAGIKTFVSSEFIDFHSLAGERAEESVSLVSGIGQLHRWAKGL